MRLLILLIFSMFFINGCSYKDMINEEMENKLKVKTLNSDNLEKQLNISKIRHECLDLSYLRNLEDLLNELSKIEKRVYYLDFSSKNINTPVFNNGICVKSFNELNNVLKKTIGYSIKIKDDNLYKNRPKIVKVRNEKVHFKNAIYPISITNNRQDVAMVLDEIAKNYNYNITYNQEDLNVGGNISSSRDQKKANYFTGKYINFKGKKVEDLLDYISDSLNLYYEVYPDKRLIKFSKFKTKRFKLIIENTVIDTVLSPNADGSSSSNAGSNNSSSSGSSSASSTSSISSFASKYKVKLYEKIKDAIETILDKKNTNKKDYVQVFQNGTILVKTTKNKMEEIHKIILDYNKSFSQDIELIVETFEVAMSREINQGIDLESLAGKYTGRTNFNAQTVGRRVFNGQKSILVNSLSKYGKVIDIRTIRFSLKNHIPSYKDKRTSRDYFEKIDLVQNGTDENGKTIYNIQPTIGTVLYGLQGVALASTMGDKINVRISMVASALESIQEVKRGDSTVTLTTKNNDDFIFDGSMKNGERRIMDALYLKSDSNDYKGIIPIDDFIIGGNRGGKYIRRAIVFVVQVKKVEDN